MQTLYSSILTFTAAAQSVWQLAAENSIVLLRSIVLMFPIPGLGTQLSCTGRSWMGYVILAGIVTAIMAAVFVSGLVLSLIKGAVFMLTEILT